MMYVSLTVKTPVCLIHRKKMFHCLQYFYICHLSLICTIFDYLYMTLVSFGRANCKQIPDVSGKLLRCQHPWFHPLCFITGFLDFPSTYLLLEKSSHYFCDYKMCLLVSLISYSRRQFVWLYITHIYEDASTTNTSTIKDYLHAFNVTCHLGVVILS